MDEYKNEIVLELPNISEVTFSKIDKAYLKVIFINFFLFFIPLLITLIVLQLYAFSDEIKEYSIFICIGFFLFFGLILAYFIFSFPLRMYALRDKDISYKSGLFFKTLTTVPFARIQHIEIDEGPISRIFGLASLSVYTAGDSSDDLEIRGINKEKALQIKEFLSTKVND